MFIIYTSRGPHCTLDQVNRSAGKVDLNMKSIFKSLFVGNIGFKTRLSVCSCHFLKHQIVISRDTIFPVKSQPTGLKFSHLRNYFLTSSSLTITFFSTPTIFWSGPSSSCTACSTFDTSLEVRPSEVSFVLFTASRGQSFDIFKWLLGLCHH